MKFPILRGSIQAPVAEDNQPQAQRILAKIVRRLEAEGAQKLSPTALGTTAERRSANCYSFEGGERAIAAKAWGFMRWIASGEVEVSTAQEQITVSYRLSFGDLAIIIFSFWVLNCLFILCRVATQPGEAVLTYLTPFLAITGALGLGFLVVAAFAIVRFRQIVSSCLKK